MRYEQELIRECPQCGHKLLEVEEVYDNKWELYVECEHCSYMEYEP